MKNFHQNLLIVFALALCLLCAVQWYRETGQRNQIEGMNAQLSQRLAAIQDYTNSIRILDGKVAQLDGQITGLNDTIKTNNQLIVTQKRELNRLAAENESLTNQITEYKQAVEAYKTKLKEAYGGVQKQNDAIKLLVTQRDEFVQKLNDSIKDRNEIVGKYNELAAKVEKAQNGKQ